MGKDLTIEPEIREVLGEGDFMTRIYQRNRNEPPVDLFIAYFPTQRTGSTIHSPQNCLPGSGWTPEEHIRIAIPRPGQEPLIVNHYLISKGLDSQLVLYWYQAHGRVLASEYWAKFFLVADAIRMNRSDGGLVRIITPVGKNESTPDAQSRALDFAAQLIPLLGKYLPN